MVDKLLSHAKEKPHNLSVDEMSYLLSLFRKEDLEKLFFAARELKLEKIGKGVSVRGLIEAGNICSKNCFYCGIRKSAVGVKRYQLSSDDIYSAAISAKNLGYASIVIQSGEIESEAHTCFIEEVLLRLKPLDLGITLSLGEQTKEVYERWHNAGASRYLLRIETSNKELYARIHPKECSWYRRRECIKFLRETGYQVGTGVMCGLPEQTTFDLARDIKFFGDMDVDMIGMGPYIPCEDTELIGDIPSSHDRFLLGLKMIAITRLYLHDVNIASATALQALECDGRESGILSGANVIMPNVTAREYRKSYQLYEGKPSLDDDVVKCRNELDCNLANIGEFILYNSRGDSRHFREKEYPQV